MRPSNILHIIVHDLGAHLNCYGRQDVSSPNLDRLAGKGIRFARCFTASPPCSPARGCLMTGRYAHANGLIGLTHRGFDLPDGERTIVDHLNDAGYLTAHIGFQHERSDPLANRYQYNDQESIWCQEVTPRAVSYIDRLATRREAPFYLNIGFQETHLPFDRPEYRPADPGDVVVPPWLPDNTWVRDELARFHGSIRCMDECVGSILETLASSGLDETTFVMFTTDHGMAFPRAKATLYDPGIETALIMRMPAGDGPAGVVAPELISSVDIAPTLLEIAGAPVPGAVQGRSFRGLLTGDSYEPRECVFSEKNYQDIYDPTRCVRTGRFKYIRSWTPQPRITISKDMIWESGVTRGMMPWAAEPRPAEELYDLSADAYETTNLAESPEAAGIRGYLRDRLEEWMSDTGDPLLRGDVPRPPHARVDDPYVPDPEEPEGFRTWEPPGK